MDWLSCFRITRSLTGQRPFRSDFVFAVCRLQSTRRLARFALYLALTGCAATVPEPQSPVRAQPVSAPVRFAFLDAEGRTVSSESLRGRRTLLVFITTYDLGAQLLSRRAEEILRSVSPRVNVLGVVMERGAYLPLLETYAETVGISYPLVLADAATFEGRGPLGDVDYVPTLVGLDADLRRVFKLEGTVTVREIERYLARVR